VKQVPVRLRQHHQYRGRRAPEWATPWTLITKYGLRIAVIGLTTSETPTSTAARNIRGLAFGNGAQAIKRYLPAARAASDFVILVAHAGAVCDSGAMAETGASCHGEIFDVARQLDSGSVDLIVAGHTHQRNQHGREWDSHRRGAVERPLDRVVDFVRTRGVGGTRRNVRVQLVTPYADQVRPDGR